MKNIKYLVILLVAILFVPMVVFAADEEVTSENTGDSNAVTVYLFRGEGCPHCEEALTWFDSIKGEYGSKFNIVDYETWYNEDNANLMSQVAEARGEEAEGVPYIIIGDKSWSGFSEADYAEEIKSQIDTLYAQDPSSRYDIMNYLGTTPKKDSKDDDKGNNDVLALILILIITGGVGFGIYKARETSK